MDNEDELNDDSNNINNEMHNSEIADNQCLNESADVDPFTKSQDLNQVNNIDGDNEKIQDDQSLQNNVNDTKTDDKLNDTKSKEHSSDDEDDEDNEYKYDPTPNNSFPSPKWHSVKQFQQREYGYLMKPGRKQSFSYKFNPHSFSRYAYNSLYFIQRLELLNELEEHHGCVNCLNFNNSGDLLCSGSDDLRIAIWDWQKSKLRQSYHSGHTSNVFQCKWCLDGNHIVSCARDGLIRICNLNRSQTITSNKLAKHNGPAHKLITNSPQVILSCGEDALVMEMDLRLDKPNKLVYVKDDAGRKVALYSIHSNPLFNPYHFIVSGRDPFVRIFDRRFLTNEQGENKPLKSLCPEHLIKSKHSVTCAQYNSNSDLVLATYNDEDIYTFNVEDGKVANFYQGHRNNATVKGCSWFGDDFILSGSDDGYIYGWEKTSQHIVMSLYADEAGVVNCIEPHPTIPVIASSGLDHNVKLWVPTSKQWPQTLKGIKKRICTNMRDRKIEQKRFSRLDDEDSIDASMLFLIIRHMRRQRQRAARHRRNANHSRQNEANGDGEAMESEDNDLDDLDDDDDLDNDDDDDDSDSEDGRNVNQCIQS